MIKPLAIIDLKRRLEHRGDKDSMIDLSNVQMQHIDVTGWKLDHIDFSYSIFEHCTFSEATLEQSCLENALFVDCSFHRTNLRDSNLRGAEFRDCDLSGAHLEGVDLYSAVLESAHLENVNVNEQTKFFKMTCPEEGAFIGYKKCCNDRLVQLLIPADARRSSATYRSGRCDLAKVLSIKSFDGSESFTEAWSLVDDDFVYRVGEYVSEPDFDENRWKESAKGIHFWMTREEAIAY